MDDLVESWVGPKPFMIHTYVSKLFLDAHTEETIVSSMKQSQEQFHQDILKGDDSQEDIEGRVQTHPYTIKKGMFG